MEKTRKVREKLKAPASPSKKIARKPAAKKPVKKKVGRKCSICHHTDKDQINSLIHKGDSFRAISRQVQNDEKLRGALQRHAENCLKIELAALIQKKKEEQALDVYKEFEENLAFARSLRLSAYEYLADPLDPLKISIIPFAHEIDVSYFDNTDLTEGKFPRPQKKKSTLDKLLMQIEQLRNLDVDKVTIKHVDLRSFALDTIRAVDICVDKFARLGGQYKKEQPNDTDTAALAKKVAARLVSEHGWTQEMADQHARALYDLPLISDASN